MLNTLKISSVYMMSVFYVGVGTDHFRRPEWYLEIVPPFLPYKFELVLISGLAEVILGFMLLYPKMRFFAGNGLILLLVLVYPANIYLAYTNGAALGTSPLVAWGRLPLQFVFIGMAYLHSKL
ncbi:MAG: DoxX family protein [Candidatus Neomarinimicrobiota bacterium]